MIVDFRNNNNTPTQNLSGWIDSRQSHNRDIDENDINLSISIHICVVYNSLQSANKNNI